MQTSISVQALHQPTAITTIVDELLVPIFAFDFVQRHHNSKRQTDAITLCSPLLCRNANPPIILAVIGLTALCARRELVCDSLHVVPLAVNLPCLTFGIARQAPLSMGLSRKEYWSEESFLSPGDLLNLRTELEPPALQADSLLPEPPGKP